MNTTSPSDLIRTRSVAAALVFVLKIRAVELSAAPKLASAAASISAPTSIASDPLSSNGALKLILPMVLQYMYYMKYRFNKKNV